MLPMQAEHPSLFVQWVGEGAVGRMRSVCSGTIEGWAAALAQQRDQCPVSPVYFSVVSMPPACQST